MYSFQGLDDQQPSSSGLAADSLNVETTRPNYIEISRYNVEEDKMTVSGQLATPKALAPSEEQEKNFDETLFLIPSENRESLIIYETVPRVPSNDFQLIGWPPRAWKRLSVTPISNFSSWEYDMLTGAYREDLVRKDVSFLYKRAIIENMRHSYNEHSVPRPGRLSKCSCSSCWAENLQSISAGSVKPTIPFGYSPSRTAEKCERPGIRRRVRFSNMQKTLTFDVSSGKVFDLEKGKTDLSCMHKEVGEMITYGSDNEDFYRANSYYDDSEEVEVVHDSVVEDEYEASEHGEDCDLSDE